jgi:hypothetical protein
MDPPPPLGLHPNYIYIYIFDLQIAWGFNNGDRVSFIYYLCLQEPIGIWQVVIIKIQKPPKLWN